MPARRGLAPALRSALGLLPTTTRNTMNRLPLRLRLPLLVAGTTLPLILFAAGLVYHKHMRDREAAFDRVLGVVKNIQVVLDTELQGITLALEVLSNTRSLRNDDLDAFRGNAVSFLRRYPASSVSLSRQDGSQVFNTSVPAGQLLQKSSDLASIEAVFRAGQPVYSDLFMAADSKRRIVTVNLPVFRDARVVYEITF